MNIHICQLTKHAVTDLCIVHGKVGEQAARQILRVSIQHLLVQQQQLIRLLLFLIRQQVMLSAIKVTVKIMRYDTPPSVKVLLVANPCATWRSGIKELNSCQSLPPLIHAKSVDDKQVDTRLQLRNCGVMHLLILRRLWIVIGNLAIVDLDVHTSLACLAPAKFQTLQLSSIPTHELWRGHACQTSMTASSKDNITLMRDIFKEGQEEEEEEAITLFQTSGADWMSYQLPHQQLCHQNNP